MTTSPAPTKKPAAGQRSVGAVRSCAIVVISIMAWLFLAAASASAAPNDINGPIEVDSDSPVLQPFLPPFLLNVDADIEIDCSLDVAHVVFINNSSELKTFRLTIFSGPGGTTEHFDVGPDLTHVTTVNGIATADLTVDHDGNELAHSKVNCNINDLLVPVEPLPPLLPVTPVPSATPLPTVTPVPTVPPLLLPSVGTEASVVVVACGEAAVPNQILVLALNDTTGDRTFEMFRSNDNSIEPRSTTLGAGQAIAEEFDAVNGTHLVQVYVGAIAILEEEVIVDCGGADGPDLPEGPGQLVPVGPEGIPAGPQTEPVVESPANPAPVETQEVLVDEAPAELAAVEPASELALPVADQSDTTQTTPGLLLVIVFGGGLVACAALAGVALGRSSTES